MEILLNNYKVELIKVNKYNTNEHILNCLPIYIINLSTDIIRRKYIKFLMNKMKINHTLVIVNKIDDEFYNEFLKTKSNLDRNRLGCVMSHLYCIRECINSNYNKFLIFEDDIIFHKNLSKLLTYEVINQSYDMLMLGAIDFSLKLNSQNAKIIDKENAISIYNPSRMVLGAHANIYTLQFAKDFFKYKMENAVTEFDTDYMKFYKTHTISVCLPNLIICELSTTNLGHHFGPISKNQNAYYLGKAFPSNFTYKEYNYITINFIEFTNNVEVMLLNDFEKIVDLYIEKCRQCDEDLKEKLKDDLLNGGYNLNDLKNIIKTN